VSEARRASRIREVRLYVSGPPGAVLDRFEAALERAGLFSVVRGDWSIAASPVPSTVDDTVQLVAVGAMRPAVAGGRSPGPGTIPSGGAQLAVVPVQADPTTLRAWVTWVPGESRAPGPVQSAVDLFVSGERESSRATQRALEARERASDAEASWVVQASNIRRALMTTGVPESAIKKRLETLRARWVSTRNGAKSVEEDEPPTI
jgi:hypothetical protein